MMPRNRNNYPTMNTKSNILRNMSSEDFQSTLLNCFEEKGILSGLRTHLRHQMIESLKTTEIGRQVSTTQKLHQNLSPKYQAINLIIAEYLLQQQLHYSLSVFSSEVPMLSSFPAFTNNAPLTSPSTNQGKPENISRFRSGDVCDILEALGLPEETESAKEIHLSYNNKTSNDPLLLCILRKLPAALRKVDKEPRSIPDKKSQSFNEENKCESENESLKSPSLNFKDRKRKMLVHEKVTQTENISLNNEQECLSAAGNFSKDVCIQNMMAELHNRMQMAFDFELDLARKEEWQKCRDVIEAREKDQMNLLGIEKAKMKKMGSRLKEQLQKDLEVEKENYRKIIEAKEKELEKAMEHRLLLERNNLLDEYRKINVMNQNGDFSGILKFQQDSLVGALETVQQQSTRLKQKEDLLNERLIALEKKLKKHNKIASLTKAMSDVSLQTSIGKSEEDSLENERKLIEKLKLDLEQQKNIINQRATHSNTKKQCCDKEVQTPCKSLNSTQTNTDGEYFFNNYSTEVSEDATPQKNGKNHDFNLRDIKNTRKEYFEFDSEVNKYCKGSTVNDMKHTESPLGYVLKTLHDENLSLKSLTKQQDFQIKSLIEKQNIMARDASEANLQVNTLSSQLTELQKLMNNGYKDVRRTPKSERTRIKSVPHTTEKRSKSLYSSRSIPASQHTHMEREQRVDKNVEHSGKTTSKKSSSRKIKYESSSSEENTSDLIKRRNRLFEKDNGPRRRTHQFFDDTGELSPTDDILKDVRDRLKKFERESDAVNRSYQEFKRKQTEKLEENVKLKPFEDIFDSTRVTEGNMPPASIYYSLKNNNANQDKSSPVDTTKEFYGDAYVSAELHRVPLNSREGSPYIPKRTQYAMNFENSVLQNYIVASQKVTQYKSDNPKSFADSLMKNKLQNNNLPSSGFPSENRFRGTTSFLLKRIENVMNSDRKKFDLEDDVNDNSLGDLNQSSKCATPKNNMKKSAFKLDQPHLSWSRFYRDNKNEEKESTIHSARKNVIVKLDGIDISPDKVVSQESEIFEVTKADDVVEARNKAEFIKINSDATTNFNIVSQDAVKHKENVSKKDDAIIETGDVLETNDLKKPAMVSAENKVERIIPSIGNVRKKLIFDDTVNVSSPKESVILLEDNIPEKIGELSLKEEKVQNKDEKISDDKFVVDDITKIEASQIKSRSNSPKLENVVDNVKEDSFTMDKNETGDYGGTLDDVDDLINDLNVKEKQQDKNMTEVMDEGINQLFNIKVIKTDEVKPDDSNPNSGSPNLQGEPALEVGEVQNDTLFSDDLAVPSSLEMSNNSSISVPPISEENDSFWK